MSIKNLITYQVTILIVFVTCWYVLQPAVDTMHSIQGHAYTYDYRGYLKYYQEMGCTRTYQDTATRAVVDTGESLRMVPLKYALSIMDSEYHPDVVLWCNWQWV